MASPTQWTESEQALEIVKDMGTAVLPLHGVAKSLIHEQLNNTYFNQKQTKKNREIICDDISMKWDFIYTFQRIPVT